MTDAGRRLVDLPARGTVGPADVLRRSPLPADSRPGRIRSRRQQVDVSTGSDGVLAGWLVHEGDPVDAGDPIAQLSPEVSP